MAIYKKPIFKIGFIVGMMIASFKLEAMKKMPTEIEYTLHAGGAEYIKREKEIRLSPSDPQEVGVLCYVTARINHVLKIGATYEGSLHTDTIKVGKGPTALSKKVRCGEELIPDTQAQKIFEKCKKLCSIPNIRARICTECRRVCLTPEQYKKGCITVTALKPLKENKNK